MHLENRKLPHGSNLTEIQDFLTEKFKSYFTLTTQTNYLTLKQFISLNINAEAKGQFKSIMYELKTTMEKMKVQPEKPIPTSFQGMINFLGYIS